METGEDGVGARRNGHGMRLRPSEFFVISVIFVIFVAPPFDAFLWLPLCRSVRAANVLDQEQTPAQVHARSADLTLEYLAAVGV